MLASIKKDAGKVEMKVIIRNGSTEIPEQMQGWRKYEKCNTKDIMLRNKDGKLSYLAIPKANLFEYDGKTMTTYNPGKRKLTATEQKIVDEWAKKEETINTIDTYWQKRQFMKEKGYEYLGTYEKMGSYKLTQNNEIYDDNIKGDINMQYEVRKVG